MLSKFKKFFFFFFFLLFCNFLYANDAVEVKGNKNISKNTILNLAPVNFDISNQDLINNYQKKLFDTGFFKNVFISLKDKKLFVFVEENPLINFFNIDGFDLKELKKKLYKITKIKENSIFQEYLIKEDIKQISKYLNNLGYLQSDIKYQVKIINDNKINIFYTINLNNKFKTKRIFFIGDKFFKSSTLLDVVYSSEYGWWKFLSKSSIPSESIINYDISRLKKFYLNNGFYDVQINSSSIKLIDNQYVNIIYSINSGDKYVIDEIELVDNSKLVNVESINFLKKKYLEFSKSFYNDFEVKRLLKFSSDYLTKSNYNIIVVNNLTKTNLNKLKLSFIISSQPEIKIIDRITITGNSVTDDFVIRNFMKQSEGDIFNRNKYLQSIEKLKGNGLFKNVTSEIIPLNKEKVQINIKVEEVPTGEISGGAGAGTNGANISGGIRENNFLGKGIKLNSNLNIGTQKIFGFFEYIDPDYQSSGNSLGLKFFAENNEFDNASYQNKLIGASIYTNYEIFDQIFLNPGFTFEFDSVSANSDASSLVKKRDGDYWSSKGFYSLSKNTKNRSFQTSEGYNIGFGQGIALLSEIPFISNSIFGSYYHEYKENFIGSVRSKVETINAFGDDVKFSDRLFVSSNNLRGFSHRGIGPKIDNDFIGGNYSFYTSFSSTIPNGLPDKWNAISNIFLDTANVWGVDDNSAESSNKIRSSLGFGFSWVSPLGPISITYAEPISKLTTDDVEQFNFKIGSAF